MPAIPERQALRQVVVDSLCLRDNPLGDPHVRRFPVYVPPQYDTELERRFPVVWLLAGYAGWGEQKATTVRAWEEPLPDQLDRLMRAGDLEPALVAFPDCFTRFGGSQYRNSLGTGRYGDYLADELVSAVDARFRTQADRDRRAVMGKSSGGYGALMMAMLRPDVFGLCCATAADSYFPLSCVQDFGKALQVYHRHGGPEGFVAAFAHKRTRTPAELTAMMVLAYAQCYSPNAHVPVYGADLPFDLDTGEMITATWRRWLACDPVSMVEGHVEALRGMRLLFLDAGTSDEWFLNFGHRVLASRLRHHKIPFEFEEFDGGHMGVGYRVIDSLRHITAALRR